MSHRIILAAVAAIAAAGPLPAQSKLPAAPAAVAPKSDLVRVALDTGKGRIVLELDQGKAPVTVANFLAYLDKSWLDGQPFYRAMPYGDGGLIQGGVRDGGKQLPPIRTEPTGETGLKNVAGTIAMANGGPNTTRSDFFIMTTDIPAFDGPSRIRRLRTRGGRNGRGEGDPRRAYLADAGRRRDEGSDARSGGGYREGNAGHGVRITLLW